MREDVEEDGANGTRVAKKARGPSVYSRGYVRNGIIVKPVIQRCMRPGEGGLGEFYCGNQVRVWSRQSASSTSNRYAGEGHVIGGGRALEKFDGRVNSQALHERQNSDASAGACRSGQSLTKKGVR